MCVSNKTKKTRYIFNTSCKADKESPRIAQVPFSYLYGMWVMKMITKVQQDLWHPRGDIVREGLDTTS